VFSETTRRNNAGHIAAETSTDINCAATPLPSSLLSPDKPKKKYTVKMSVKKLLDTHREEMTKAMSNKKDTNKVFL